LIPAERRTAAQEARVEMRNRSLNFEIRPDGSFQTCEHMRNDFNSMKLVGYRPDGSFLKVRMETDTPDGTYWLPEVQIVVGTASGWSLWRYVLTILKTVLRPSDPRVRNLILAGVGIGRLAGVPGIRWLKGWAANRGVLLSGSERSYPCQCRNCIGRDRPSGSPGCRGGTAR
jgi:hypothetical protein